MKNSQTITKILGIFINFSILFFNINLAILPLAFLEKKLTFFNVLFFSSKNCFLRNVNYVPNVFFAFSKNAISLSNLSREELDVYSKNSFDYYQENLSKLKAVHILREKIEDD